MASANAAVENMPRISKTHGTASSLSYGVVILDAGLRPVALDRGAEAIFATLNAQSSSEGHGIPESLLSRLGSLTLDDGTRFYLASGGGEYSCRVFVVRPHAGGDPMLTLYLKRELSVTDAVRHIAADYHLTDREQEALIGICMGDTRKELATKMKISPNTVKAFVRLAMVKMGTRNRAHLFAKLLDTQAG